MSIELLALAKDKKNSSNYPAKPTAIQPLTLGLKTLRPNRLYQIKTAIFADQDGDEISVWHIDTTKVILVNKEGNATIHWRQHIEMSDFTHYMRKAPSFRAGMDSVGAKGLPVF